jgi:hypothetical protein
MNEENKSFSAENKPPLTKLTAAMFEAGGVEVPNRPPARELRQPQLIIPPLSKDERIRQGEAAMLRLGRGQTWADWKQVLEVANIARAEAKIETGHTRGKHFTEAYRRWFRDHPVPAIARYILELDPATRSRFLKCAENIDAIDQWRASLAPLIQLKLNYPESVLAAWQQSTRKPADEPEENSAESNSTVTLKIVLDWLAQEANVKDKQRVCAALLSNVQDMLAYAPSKLLDEFRSYHLSRLSQEHGGKARIDRLIRNSGGKVTRLSQPGSPTSH